MFGKYFIHELKNTFKLPLIGILICMFSGLVSGLCINIESEILTSAAILLIFATLISIIVLMFVTIAKVYSSRLFNSKGYLTLTLPVKTNTILISKTVLVTAYTLLYYFGLALTIYLFLQGAFLISMKGSLSVLADFIKEITYTVLGINANLPFVVNLLTFLDRFITFCSLLMLVLFGLTIRNIGWKKAFSNFIVVLIIIFIVFVLPNINKVDFLPSFFYDYNKNVYLFMTKAELKELYEGQQIYSFDVATLVHFVKYFFNFTILFGGYFLSKYFIQNKLDIR